MTHSEPMIPGTVASVVLLVGAFVIATATLIAGLYGLYALSRWVIALL